MFCVWKKLVSTVRFNFDFPSTETPLQRVAFWGTGHSGLHPWWLCLLLHLPLPPPADAHLPGHADLCTWEAILALLLHCRAACKNTGPVHISRATKTKWAMYSTPANTHIITLLTAPGTYTFFTACAGLSRNTCWIRALHITRWACIFTFARSNSAASSGSTVHTVWLAQSNSGLHICLRITYRSSQAKGIQSVWDANTARSFYTGQWTSRTGPESGGPESGGPSTDGSITLKSGHRVGLSCCTVSWWGPGLQCLGSTTKRSSCALS